MALTQLLLRHVRLNLGFDTSSCSDKFFIAKLLHLFTPASAPHRKFQFLFHRNIKAAYCSV